jgi:hypothetical protein
MRAPSVRAEAERSVFHSQFDFAEARWERVSDQDADIQVYRWRPADKELFAFRGEGDVDAPLPRIVGVIADHSRQKEWVPDLGESRLVERISALERIQYLHFKTPFIIKDRDFVVGTQANFDSTTRTMTLDFASIEDPRVPPTDKIRGKILHGQYLLQALGDGSKTRVTIQVYLDPMGSVPKWLVNATQVGFPRRALRALRDQVTKDDVKEHPLARAAMDGKFHSQTEMLAWLKTHELGAPFN